MVGERALYRDGRGICAFARRGLARPQLRSIRMDQVTLVEDGAEGLNRIAEVFRSRGVPVTGVYLIKVTSQDEFEYWIIRLVVDRKIPDMTRKMIYELVRLRRDNQLPKVDPSVR